VKLPEPFANSLILTGPTASGKSELALELTERMDAEIIALDSMTLYRGMDIGTAKPSLADRARVPHHLIDVLDPWESGNVAWWLREAARCTREIEARGKQVLFVGGTPFYLKALLQGLFDSPPVDPEIRARLEKEAELDGAAALHARLAAIDPASAARLHPNDIRRVVRALEVWELTGKPLSSWQQQGWWGETPAAESEEFPRCLVVDVDRQILYDRINQRVLRMIEAGWIEEVRKLRDLPRSPGKEASQALGYAELLAVIKGRESLEQAVATIQLRSRQFAKRQLTWFRSLPGCQVCEGKLTFEVWRRTIRI